MKVTLTDVYGQTVIINDVVSVFTSIVEDNILCIMVKDEEKERRYNIKSLSYWEIIKWI